MVGTGEIATRFMLGINHIEGLNIVGVFSRDILKAKRFSEAWGIKYFTNNLNNICGDIDIAYISTPTITHSSIASILIKKQINVLIEKPIVTSLTQLHQLSNLAKLYGVNIIDGMWTLYNPLISSACLMSKIYTPNSIESYLCFDNNANSNILTDDQNGGAVKDILTYQLYLVALFCNPEELELVNCQKFFNDHNVDYKYNLNVKSNEIIANLKGNIASKNRSRLIIHYKDFYILIFNPIYNPKLLLFLPRKYCSIKIIFMCFFSNINIIFSSLKIYINRAFMNTYLYKNPLHDQLIELMGIISGNIKKPTISFKMTCMVVGILDKLTK
jgi:predicted dehydrogenase